MDDLNTLAKDTINDKSELKKKMLILNSKSSVFSLIIITHTLNTVKLKHYDSSQ